MTTLTRYQSSYSSFTYRSACTGFDDRVLMVPTHNCNHFPGQGVERHRQKLVTQELEIYERRENEAYNHAAVK